MFDESFSTDKEIFIRKTEEGGHRRQNLAGQV